MLTWHSSLQHPLYPPSSYRLVTRCGSSQIQHSTLHTCINGQLTFHYLSSVLFQLQLTWSVPPGPLFPPSNRYFFDFHPLTDGPPLSKYLVTGTAFPFRSDLICGNRELVIGNTLLFIPGNRQLIGNTLFFMFELKPFPYLYLVTWTTSLVLGNRSPSALITRGYRPLCSLLW